MKRLYSILFFLIGFIVTNATRAKGVVTGRDWAGIGRLGEKLNSIELELKQ
jgi:hypothetical protein